MQSTCMFVGNLVTHIASSHLALPQLLMFSIKWEDRLAIALSQSLRHGILMPLFLIPEIHIMVTKGQNREILSK
jgi:hypothetical protein